MIERDVAGRRQAMLLAALLDHETPPWPTGELPPLGHWLHFPPATRQSGIAEDGHPIRPVGALPRRMWAGSRVRFHAPIPFAAEMVRETSELGLVEKHGRSGAMQFLTLRHAISLDGRLAIEEEQDLVYREATAPGASARPAAPDAVTPLPPITRVTIADPVQLFRYSALTFNGHRIHYDRQYAAEREGYPGLVVHGPYIATLLLDLFLRERPGARVAGFSFRALRPTFEGERFTLGMTLTAAGAELLSIDAAGGIAMRAEVIVG